MPSLKRFSLCCFFVCASKLIPALPKCKQLTFQKGDLNRVENRTVESSCEFDLCLQQQTFVHRQIWPETTDKYKGRPADLVICVLSEDSLFLCFRCSFKVVVTTPSLTTNLSFSYCTAPPKVTYSVSVLESSSSILRIASHFMQHFFPLALFCSCSWWYHHQNSPSLFVFGFLFSSSSSSAQQTTTSASGVAKKW